MTAVPVLDAGFMKAEGFAKAALPMVRQQVF